MEIISHVNTQLTNPVQLNSDHSNGVSEMAGKFAVEFGFGVWGNVMGQLHDKGKERLSFQSYIREKSGYDIANVNPYDDKSHAYVGALIAKKLYGSLSELIINQIAGHHAGLYDYCELEEIMKRPIPEEINCDLSCSNLSVDCLKKVSTKKELNHLWRMLYSCLVDADFLDTERFMNIESFKSRGVYDKMDLLKQKLDMKLLELGNIPDTPINKIRRLVQLECLKQSEGLPGFYSLTVPTGGGKTISSIVWAVNHAIKNGKKRIIIAIPYTSIIVQTAGVLKSIFGEENVLEHHSNSDYSQIRDAKLRQQMKLATENWDYPIIITTNVQLFESMYSNKPSHCRKLHNICNSIIILDEVQTLPVGFLQPIVDSLKCYQHLFGISVLFTTASQPILSGMIEGCNPRARFEGIDHIEEIIPDGIKLHDDLRRVRLEIDDNPKSYDEVAQMLGSHDRVLCIVNTRKVAKELFSRLPDDGIKLHLSRMMCPTHIRKTIEDVKKALNNNDNKTIRVIATQLIEAGVDIDFPVVYRQEAGLDSVLQAAGRCNREGKLDICTTHVFSLGKEGSLPLGSITTANNARKNIVGQRDWFDPETMIEYFRQLYCREQTFDAKDMAHYLYNPKEMCFESAAKSFRLIDDNGVNVVVNWGDSLKYIEKIKREGASYQLMKKLSLYSVNVRVRDFNELKKGGLIEEVMDGIYLINKREQYDEKVGLLTENQWLEEILIQ